MSSIYINKIVINTDSRKIADGALRHFDHLTILERPDEIRGDFVSMNPIIAYDLSQTEGEYFLQTHSTNPLLTTATIDKAIECYFKSLDTHDSLFSVTRHQVRLFWQDGRPINHNPHELIRTQDLQPVCEENSNIYIFSRASFAESGNRRIGLKPQMFEMDRFEAMDIDEEQDFKLAELIYQLGYNKGGI